MDLLKVNMNKVLEFQEAMLKKYPNQSIRFDIHNSKNLESSDELIVKCSKGDKVIINKSSETKYYQPEQKKVEAVYIRYNESLSSYEEYNTVAYKDENGYFLKDGRIQTDYFDSLEEIVMEINKMGWYKYLTLKSTNEDSSYDYEVTKRQEELI